MRRRAFIAGLLLSPAAARAQVQQWAKVAKVGLLDPGIPHLFEAYRDAMAGLGYVEGQNVVFVHRSAHGRAEDVGASATELARLNVDVIVTAATLPVRSAAEATSTIPIVFAALGDAVRTGVVQNLARPERNLTGLSFLNSEISAKRLELLREALPGAKRVAVFDDPSTIRFPVEATEVAARGLGLEVKVIAVPGLDAFEQGFRAAVDW